MLESSVKHKVLQELSRSCSPCGENGQIKLPVETFLQADGLWREKADKEVGAGQRLESNGWIQTSG